MTFLSNADLNHFFGNGPKVVSKIPNYRLQGNGNYTGFILTTYSNGRTSTFEFLVNAKTIDEVLDAYHNIQE